MFGEKTERTLLKVGLWLFLIAFITIGASSKIMEKKIGKDIKEYKCQILELDEGTTVKYTSNHKRRTIYHFNATVEVNGKRMTLTTGNNEYYMHKYDEGDMIEVYEYHNKYSFARSDFLVTSPFRIIGIMGIAFGIMCLMMAFLSKMAGAARGNQSTPPIGNLNANINGDYNPEEKMDAYKAQLVDQTNAAMKQKGKIAGCFMFVVLIVVAIIVIVAVKA